MQHFQSTCQPVSHKTIHSSSPSASQSCSQSSSGSFFCWSVCRSVSRSLSHCFMYSAVSRRVHLFLCLLFSQAMYHSFIHLISQSGHDLYLHGDTHSLSVWFTESRRFTGGKTFSLWSSHTSGLVLDFRWCCMGKQEAGNQPSCPKLPKKSTNGLEGKCSTFIRLQTAPLSRIY